MRWTAAVVRKLGTDTDRTVAAELGVRAVGAARAIDCSRFLQRQGGMSHEVCCNLELDVQPGREDELRALMDEMVGAAQAYESGTLDYEWSMSADGTVCHLYERYADWSSTDRRAPRSRMHWPDSIPSTCSRQPACGDRPGGRLTFV